ncbi:succinylglutamate desuccinylase/aspartoacylase family protein [Sulfurimonas sp. HSL-3221]|uniref:succinylglutamate desuccinylase/aspartoacylase family protein n=1 Tax=Sulfurimonadaceae TaxID=2771471 RepID=UPI001E56D500|nr:succinylglutamate desuccinylase/aspartoacylase family protein [Sulfurimonas sp. HSL-3221]UFS63690.1 succinylglutamate desuccinylase/aspartoacylase family protein [Sulfurimonas sp. HSL-3221]
MFEIAGITVARGERKVIPIPLPALYSEKRIDMPVEVVRGKRKGPTLFVSATVHGDELNGIEIIRRLLQLPQLAKLRGTIVAVPVVNPYGLIQHSRYLPDRRDLNRSFPGMQKGSLASRVAKIFMDEIVDKSDAGIDLHTGAVHRSNFPQVRANLEDETTLAMAEAFRAPVLMHSALRDGSLREAAVEKGVPILLYEGGEALRYDELSIRTGLKGIVHVMRHLGMLPKTTYTPKKLPTVTVNSSKWLRSPQSGLMRSFKGPGSFVKEGELLAQIDVPLQQEVIEVYAEFDGIIIGRLETPLVYEGDAIFHIATKEKAHSISHLEALEALDESAVGEAMPSLLQDPPLI